MKRQRVLVGMDSSETIRYVNDDDYSTTTTTTPILPVSWEDKGPVTHPLAHDVVSVLESEYLLD